MTSERPSCPLCTVPIERLQRSCGVVAAYPCLCWLAPFQATQVVQDWRRRTAA